MSDTGTQSTRQLSMRLLGPASIYVVIRLLSQGLVLGATLLLARMLPLAAFASIGTALLIQAFLLPLSGLALHGGLERLYAQYTPDERGAKIYTITLASLLANMVVALAAFLLLATAVPLEFITSAEVAITLVSVVLQSIQYVPLVVMRCEERMRAFAGYQMAFVIVTQSAILIAVFLDHSVHAYFFGMLIGSVFGFAMWLIWLARRVVPRLVSIRREFTYAAPSVPIGVLEAVQQTVDRYVLQLFVPGSQFATYSLAQRLATPISTIAAGTKAALYPILYRIGDENDVKALLSDATNLSSAFFSVVVNGIVVAMAVVVEYFLPGEFRAVFPIFVVIVAGLYFRVQEIFFGVGADIRMQLHKQLFVLAPILVIQTVLSIALTLSFGLMGAAAAFAANGAIRLLAVAILGHRLLPRELRLAEYLAVMLAALAPLVVYLVVFELSASVLGIDKMLVVLPVLLMVVLIGLARARPPAAGDRKAD